MPYYPPPGSFGIAQTTADPITVDTTTSSATWVDLISRTMTTGDGFIIAIFTAFISTSTNNKATGVRLVLDGTAVRAGTVTLYTTASCYAIEFHKAVTAGSHTVKVQWQSAGTAQIRPVTLPDQESAILICEEVSV